MTSPGREYRREIDAIYPEHMSRLNRASDQHASLYRRSIRKKLSRSGRFRTTPITIDEIKEVDEDAESVSEAEEIPSKAEHALQKQFEQFSKRRKRRVFRKGEQFFENQMFRNDIIEGVEPDSPVEARTEMLYTKVIKEPVPTHNSRTRTSSSSL